MKTSFAYKDKRIGLLNKEISELQELNRKAQNENINQGNSYSFLSSKQFSPFSKTVANTLILDKAAINNKIILYIMQFVSCYFKTHQKKNNNF